MKHSTGTFKGAGEVALYYQRWQHVQEPPRAVLAIVHGFGEHSGRYPTVVERLTARGYIVYGFDHRGHGRSPGPRGHIDMWAEYRQDVTAFLRLIARQEPALPLFLLGHSLGGLIVLEYALRHPEGLCGVIASGPALGQPGLSPALLALSRILSRVQPRFSMETRLDAATLSRDPAVLQAHRDDPLVHSRGSARLGTEVSAAAAWTQAHASDLRVPLLIVHGGADRLVPPEQSRIFFDHVVLADKERYEYAGVYHEPHNDVDAARVLADVERWLERHLPRGEGDATAGPLTTGRTLAEG